MWSWHYFTVISLGFSLRVVSVGLVSCAVSSQSPCQCGASTPGLLTGDGWDTDKKTPSLTSPQSHRPADMGLPVYIRILSTDVSNGGNRNSLVYGCKRYLCCNLLKTCFPQPTSVRLRLWRQKQQGEEENPIHKQRVVCPVKETRLILHKCSNTLKHILSFERVQNMKVKHCQVRKSKVLLGWLRGGPRSSVVGLVNTESPTDPHWVHATERLDSPNVGSRSGLDSPIQAPFTFPNTHLRHTGPKNGRLRSTTPTGTHEMGRGSVWESPARAWAITTWSICQPLIQRSSDVDITRGRKNTHKEMPLTQTWSKHRGVKRGFPTFFPQDFSTI